MTAPARWTPETWDTIAADHDLRQRFEARLYRRGPDECAFWLGAISDSGHGKLKTTRGVVSTHVLAYVLANGPITDPEQVVRHRCDESSCGNARCLLAGTRTDNRQDWLRRRDLPGSPLADVRGAAGRAVAIRDAILTALGNGADPAAVEVAIWQASTAGTAHSGEQGTLWA